MNTRLGFSPVFIRTKIETAPTYILGVIGSWLKNIFLRFVCHAANVLHAFICGVESILCRSAWHLGRVATQGAMVGATLLTIDSLVGFSNIDRYAGFQLTATLTALSNLLLPLLYVVLLCVAIKAIFRILGYIHNRFHSRDLEHFEHSVLNTVRQENSHHSQIPKDLRLRKILLLVKHRFGELASSYGVARSESLNLRHALSTLSHDILKPVSVMRLVVEDLSLKSTGIGAPARNDELETLSKNLHAINRYIHNYQDWCSLHQVTIFPKPDCIEIEEQIEEIVSRFQPLARERGIRLHCTGKAHGAFIRCSASYIDRALSNLIDNAIRYSPDASLVEVLVEKERSSVVISVIDSGAGFDESVLQSLGTPFVRGKAGRTLNTTGWGLGLALVHGIVARHGGDLRIAPGSASGSVVQIALPSESASSRRTE